jgi:hypothetical protein
LDFWNVGILQCSRNPPTHYSNNPKIQHAIASILASQLENGLAFLFVGKGRRKISLTFQNGLCIFQRHPLLEFRRQFNCQTLTPSSGFLPIKRYGKKSYSF